MPWIIDAPALGHSYRKAVKFFLSQEKRLQNNHDLKTRSNDFMLEYINMGHMKEVAAERCADETGNVYYIPWISILRQDAVTTKLRNVFHASMPTSNGVTLNDTMHEGPKLQNLIFNVKSGSRKFRYIYSADITKMFRQILIPPEDSDRMRIIWRAKQSYPLHEYELTTVTYGTDAAP